MRRPPPVLLAALAIALVVCLVHARELFLGETWVARDHLSWSVPAREHLASSLAGGRIPEWWDGIGLGTPFAGMPASGVTYPPAWLVAVLPMPFGADLLLVLHVLVAGLGAAALARRLGAGEGGAVLAGVLFASSGYVSSVIVNGIAILGVAWIPWVAWGADRIAAAAERGSRARAALVGAALFAALILAGDPAAMITGALLAVGVVLSRARRRAPAAAVLGAAGVGGLLLGAVALLPALAFLGESERAGGFDRAVAEIWSMHPLRALELAWPSALGDPTIESHALARLVADASAGTGRSQPSWALGFYLGPAVFLLAALALARRELRGLAIVALAFVVLALGRYTPLHGLWWAVFPPERLVRSPEKHVVGALAIVCALAGAGFTRLFAEGAPRRALLATAGALAALAGAFFLLRGVLAGALASRGRALGLAGVMEIEAGLGDSGRGLAVTALVTAAFAAIALGRSRLRGAPLLAGALLGGHAVAAAWAILPSIDRAFVARVPALLQGADRTPDGVRERLHRAQSLRLRVGADAVETAVVAHETAVADRAARFGLADVPGYEAVSAGRYVRFWAEAPAGVPLERWFDLFDVRYAILPDGVGAGPGVTPRASQLGYTLLENEARRPRAFVATRFRHHAGDDALYGATVDLDAIGLAGPGDAADGGPLRPCALRTRRPEEVELDCETDREGYAVLLDEQRPGWSAEVDGQPRPIERADVLCRAVRIPPGRHRVVFRYRTPGLRGGALLSGLAWLAWIGAAFVTGRTSRPATPPAA